MQYTTFAMHPDHKRKFGLKMLRINCIFLILTLNVVVHVDWAKNQFYMSCARMVQLMKIRDSELPSSTKTKMLPSILDQQSWI